MIRSITDTTRFGTNLTYNRHLKCKNWWDIELQNMSKEIKNTYRKLQKGEHVHNKDNLKKNLTKLKKL